MQRVRIGEFGEDPGQELQRHRCVDELTQLGLRLGTLKCRDGRPVGIGLVDDADQVLAGLAQVILVLPGGGIATDSKQCHRREGCRGRIGLDLVGISNLLG